MVIPRLLLLAFAASLIGACAAGVWEALGSQAYTLGLVALEGESGWSADERWPIVADQRPELALEEMLAAGPWTDVIDGLVFVRRGTAPTVAQGDR
jgi:hypothetical protein